MLRTIPCSLRSAEIVPEHIVLKVNRSLWHRYLDYRLLQSNKILDTN